jgi:hypothetical protein
VEIWSPSFTDAPTVNGCTGAAVRVTLTVPPRESTVPATAAEAIAGMHDNAVATTKVVPNRRIFRISLAVMGSSRFVCGFYNVWQRILIRANEVRT